MDILTQRLIVFRKKIIAELRRLSDAIQQQEHATREATQAHEQKHGPSPEVRAVLHAPQGIETRKSTGDAQADQRHHHQILLVQWVLCFATIGAFGSAAYYAHYARKQWHTMNDTYGQIKTQAEQITNQTKLLRQQLSGTEGAVIRLSQGSPGIYSDGEIWWHIVNIGRVPATNVVIYATTSDLDVGSGKMISRGPPLRKVFPTVPHTENPNEVASGGPGEIAWYDVPVFTVPSVRWDAFSETRLALALKGTVSYNNGFDAGETIPVCYYFFAYTIIVQIGRAHV